jgi:Fe-Mn family superoxide dismutase
MNRDILRTIAHEWAHEYQKTIENMDKGPDIGGKNENKANERAGELVKRFERRHKKDEKKIYSLFSERIKELENLINEDSVSKSNIITEIKKITIEKLPYEFDSLSSFIDDETMKTHYNKHYKGYVEKLNLELEKMSGKDLDLIDIIKKISKFNKKVKNNGGGAFNHALFWKMLSPKRTELKNPLSFKIEKSFGSLDEFKEKFEEIAKTRFGSGWVWLIINKSNNLKIVTTSSLTRTRAARS